MSEYQYYEFQALDRLLTNKQIDELGRYSSRAQITPSTFINVYNYSDFRGDPDYLMEKYFDAFCYLANWGTRWLMLRIPKKLLNPETVAPFEAGECFCCREQGEYVILSFQSQEEGDGWEDGEGWLLSLIPIRTALMRGDHRALYLGWLLAVQADEVQEDVLEPAVPPGLAKLDSQLCQLVDFLRIDNDLITVAAKHSKPLPNNILSKNDIMSWVLELPIKKKDALMADLIADDDPHFITTLQNQVLDSLHNGVSRPVAPLRSAGELMEQAQVMKDARREKKATERARKKAQREREAAIERKKYIESLQNKESMLWSGVYDFIGTRQPKRYDQAISILRDLYDLAKLQGTMDEFRMKITALRNEHQKKTSLMERMHKAKLLGESI